MVTIIYYEDPFSGQSLIRECPTVIDFLRENFSSRDELLDLRFFAGEILGPEIDQNNPAFLNLSEGVVAITHDSKIPRGPDWWIYAIIFVVSAAVSYYLASQISIPSTGSSSTSATNNLNASTNEARNGERVDDVWGYVAKHTPPLVQYPYFIGIDNQEAEVLLLCVSRGKVHFTTTTCYDGDTRVIDIPNAQLSKFEPHVHPNVGTPSLQIGNAITEPVGIYRKSNDLNAAELVPPNELDTSQGAVWSITSDGSTATLTATTLPDTFVIEDNFTLNGGLVINNLMVFPADGTVTLVGNISGSTVFNKYSAGIDLGQAKTITYTVLALTENSITIEIPDDTPANVIAAWTGLSGYVPITDNMYHITGTGLDTYVRSISKSEIWTYSGNSVTIGSELTYSPLVMQSFYDSVGPFTVVAGAEQVLINLVSLNGFYKLKDNKEQTISAGVLITFEETDADGNTTGNGISYPYTYSSNSNVRKSVFQTYRIDVPYTYCRVSAKRTTDRDKSSNVSNVDNIEFRDLYFFNSIPDDHDFGNCTLAHVVIPSNSTSRLVKERKQNMDVTRVLTEYQGEGVWGTTDGLISDHFDQVLINMAMDDRIGRLALGNVAADDWLSLKNQIISYFGSDQMVRFGYDFDDKAMTFQDMFVTVATAVNCLPIVTDGVYDLVFEKQQSTPTAQITCRNKKPKTETRERVYERQYDGVAVTWRNEETGESEVFYVPEDQSSINPKTITLSGVITKEQVYKYAYRIYNKQIHNRDTIKFDVDSFGRNIICGRRVDSPDQTRFTARDGVDNGYRVYDGEVVEVSGFQVELSCPIVFTDGEDHYITFTTATGDMSDPILCTQVDDYTVLLSEMPTETIYDGYSKDRTKFVLASEQLRQSVAILPQTSEYSLEDDGTETFSITSINYSDHYYDNDQDVV